MRKVTRKPLFSQRRVPRQVAGRPYGKMDMGMSRVLMIDITDGISCREQLCHAVGKLMAEAKGIPTADRQGKGNDKRPEDPWDPELLHPAYHLEIFRQAFISRRKMQCPISAYGKMIPFGFLQSVKICDHVAGDIGVFILILAKSKLFLYNFVCVF